ncbi:MAG: response regulator transcription factor [Chloroflexota bacterium]|nr:MAG: response regulator transcription factor [Chloroflexota bacterium]
MKTRVLLADDHPVLRLGIRELLAAEPDIEIVAEAGDGREALRMARTHTPDVAVLDIAMPGLTGLEVTRQIKLLGLPCKVLIFTVHAHDQYLFHVLEAGALGYVLKTGAYEELVEAVRTVAQGHAYLRQEATRLLVTDYLERAKSGETKDSFEALSEREREVLMLTAQGFTGQEIGERLSLSCNTVQTYRRRLMEKLNLQSRAELVHYALRKGLLRPEE